MCDDLRLWDCIACLILRSSINVRLLLLLLLLTGSCLPPETLPSYYEWQVSVVGLNHSEHCFPECIKSCEYIPLIIVDIILSFGLHVCHRGPNDKCRLPIESHCVPLYIAQCICDVNEPRDERDVRRVYKYVLDMTFKVQSSSCRSLRRSLAPLTYW